MQCNNRYHPITGPRNIRYIITIQTMRWSTKKVRVLLTAGFQRGKSCAALWRPPHDKPEVPPKLRSRVSKPVSQQRPRGPVLTSVIMRNGHINEPESQGILRVLHLIVHRNMGGPFCCVDRISTFRWWIKYCPILLPKQTVIATSGLNRSNCFNIVLPAWRTCC